MKQKNIPAALMFAVCLIAFQTNLFSREPAKNATYSFDSKPLSNFRIAVSFVPVDTAEYYDDVKKIQIVKDDVVEAEYTTLHIVNDNSGEGFTKIELLSDGFIITQTFRDGQFMVGSFLVIKYEHNTFLLKEYREMVTNVLWEKQDFEFAAVSLEKGIPFGYLSDDLIYIFYGYLMLTEFAFLDEE